MSYYHIAKLQPNYSLRLEYCMCSVEHCMCNYRSTNSTLLLEPQPVSILIMLDSCTLVLTYKTPSHHFIIGTTLTGVELAPKTPCSSFTADIWSSKVCPVFLISFTMQWIFFPAGCVEENQFEHKPNTSRCICPGLGNIL